MYTHEDYKDTLTSEPVASTLKRLHKQAEEADKPLQQEYSKLRKLYKEAKEKEANKSLEQEYSSIDVIADLLKEERKNYKEMYQNKFASHYLSVTPEFGDFLYMCARTANAKQIVEFGTSFGISSIYLAAALRDNGGGELISTEIEESKALQARKNIAAAGLSDLVDIRIGDALETLSTGFKGKIDLALLDGAFSLYLPVLKLLEPHFRMGTVLISENALVAEYLKHIRNPANGYHSKKILVGEGNDNEKGNELSIVTWNKMSLENRLDKTSASISDAQSVPAMVKSSSIFLAGQIYLTKNQALSRERIVRRPQHKQNGLAVI